MPYYKTIKYIDIHGKLTYADILIHKVNKYMYMLIYERKQLVIRQQRKKKRKIERERERDGERNEHTNKHKHTQTDSQTNGQMKKK